MNESIIYTINYTREDGQITEYCDNAFIKKTDAIQHLIIAGYRRIDDYRGGLLFNKHIDGREHFASVRDLKIT